MTIEEVKRSTTSDLSDALTWHDKFKKVHGRPLRVLHVGNIAGNGYLNAKFLRRYGIEADVVSRDYYHVMALPEWEDLEIKNEHGDDNAPRFACIDTLNYVRPDWFVSGPLAHCADVIDMRNTTPNSRIIFQLNIARRRFFSYVALIAAKILGQKTGAILDFALTQPELFLKRLEQRLWPRFQLIQHLGRLKHVLTPLPQAKSDPAAKVVEAFNQTFPNRLDRLTPHEVEAHFHNAHYFKRMFRHYDLVQCYATEPIYALLAENKPYIAFEHGTLRTFTLADNAISRLTSLAYNQANHCFITNGDCLEYARAIQVKSLSALPHAIDLEQHRQDLAADVAHMRATLNADVILFCPIRHDYAVKGTDIHLRALPLIKARLAKRIKLVLVDWGQQVDESRRLVAELECSDDVIWRRAMSRVAMIKQIRASDVVLDQMALPHFGSTAPQCLAAGIPVISSYKPTSTSWMFPEPAPILSAFDEHQVVTAVETALDKQWRRNYECCARLWMDRYHSPERIVTEHLCVYQKALADV